MDSFKIQRTVDRAQKAVEEGIIDAVLIPGKLWRIKANGGVYWRGITKTDSDFSPDESVNITGRQNNRLLIEPQ